MIVSERGNYVCGVEPRKPNRISLDNAHLCRLLESSQPGNGVILKSWMIFGPLKKHLERKICQRCLKAKVLCLTECNPHCSRQCFFLQRSKQSNTQHCRFFGISFNSSADLNESFPFLYSFPPYAIFPVQLV